MFEFSGPLVVFSILAGVYLLVCLYLYLTNAEWGQNARKSLFAPETVAKDVVLAVLMLFIVGFSVDSITKSLNPTPDIVLTCTSSRNERNIRIINSGKLAGEEAYLHVYYKQVNSCARSYSVLDTRLWKNPEELKDTAYASFFPLPLGHSAKKEGYNYESLEYRQLILPQDESNLGLKCNSSDTIKVMLSGKNFRSAVVEC